MRTPVVIVSALLGISALVVSPSRALPPTSAPSTHPSAESTSPEYKKIAHSLADLADPRDSVRQQARTDLLGIKRDELALLRQAVVAQRPLQPSQVAVLHEIVSHVYLMGETYDSLNEGFLGISFSPIPINRIDDMPQQETPIVIDKCVPGFGAYGQLQAGDIITEMDAIANTHLRNFHELTTAIMAQQPGDSAHLTILRQGRELHVVISLSARPAVLGPNAAAGTVEELENARQEKADKYWNDNFAPLVDYNISNAQ